MKCRLPTEAPAQAARSLPKRWPALLALTAACVLAHAAALGGLSRMMRTAPSQPVAQHVAMHVTNVGITTTSALGIDVVTLSPAAALAVAPRTQRTVRAHANPPRPLPTDVPRELAAEAPTTAAEPAIEHLPTSALDVPPMPRSAPDEQYVEHVHRSGLPIQVRLYISADGSVTEANLLGAAPGDEEAAEQVMAMFRDTAFSPGRLQGREVAAFIDIELVLEPALPPLGRIVRQ